MRAGAGVGRLTLTPPALCRSNLDRREDVRDPARIASAWAQAHVLVLATDGTFPVRHDDAGPHLVLRPASDWGGKPLPGAMLLGCIDGQDHWAIVHDSAASIRSEVAGFAEFSSIRTIGSLLTDDDAAVAATAVALAGWHSGSVFCARCGRATAPDLAGHSRTCPVGHQEFPRTDPAVIVLVHDGADRMVLARQPSWSPGRFSVLAGFAEVGETLEATVAREISEEIGVAVTDIEYLGSQPWPFPRSLMIAFSARAAAGSQLIPRQGEIADARWFSREELRRILRAGESDRSGRVRDRHSAPGVPDITLPGPLSISRRMVEAFVDAG